MTTKLEKFSIMDARVDMSQEFKKWIGQLGAKEANLVSTPSASSANNTSASFNIQLADNTSCVIDRSNVDIEIPLTIQLNGSAGSGVPLYNPDFEGFRNRPAERMIKKLDIRGAGGQAASYEPYLMVDALECFTFDGKQRQTDPEQIDNCQAYIDYSGTTASPFAKRFDNVYRASRRAMSEIVIDPLKPNTYAACTLTTTLKLNLQDYPPFTNEVWHTGLNAQPLKIDISWYDFLPRIWSRMAGGVNGHPQPTLTSMAISIGQPTLNLICLTLPTGQVISNEQNFPYHQIDCQSCQTKSGINAGASFDFDTGVQQLDFIPSRFYLFAKPSDGFVTSTIQNQTQIPNCFTSLNNVTINFANKSGILNNYKPQHIFQVAKSNGLIPSYAYCDWVGTATSNNTVPLRGSIMAADLVKDVCNASKQITTGLSSKCNLQIKGKMTNISAQTRDFDIMLITVYDGVFSIINKNMGMTNLGIISDISELKPLDIPYAQALAMMGGANGGDVKSFFKGLWEKIKELVPIVKKSGIIGNVLGMIPYTSAAAPIVKSLGWGEGEGEGEGIYAYGEGEGEGIYAYGEGEGYMRKKKASKKGKKRGGYLA